MSGGNLERDLDAEQRALTWSEPRELVHDPLPTWPSGVLPPWADVFSRETSRSMGAPVEMIDGWVLGALSTAASGRIRVSPWPEWTETATLYTCVVLPPGAKKTPSAAAALRPIRTLEQEMIEEGVATFEEARTRRDVDEKRLASLKRAAAEATSDAARREATDEAADLARDLACRPPTQPRLTVGDATFEVIAQLLADQGERLAMVSAETSLFGHAGGRYADDPALEIALSGYDGEPVSFDRVGRPSLVLSAPVLTLVLGCQPEVIERARTRGMRGLLDRFVWIRPDYDPARAPVGRPDPIDPFTVDAYDEHLRAMLRRCRALEVPVTLRLDEDAIETFVYFRGELRGEMTPDGAFAGIEAWGSKADGRMLRIAALLHVAWGGDLRDAIDSKTIARAYAIVRVATAHARRVLLDPPEQPIAMRRARRVLSWASDATATEPRERFTTRQVQTVLRGEKPPPTKADVEATLALLEGHGYLRPLEARARADQQWWALHPAMTSTTAAAPVAEPIETALRQGYQRRYRAALGCEWPGGSDEHVRHVVAWAKAQERPLEAAERFLDGAFSTAAPDSWKRECWPWKWLAENPARAAARSSKPVGFMGDHATAEAAAEDLVSRIPTVSLEAREGESW